VTATDPMIGSPSPAALTLILSIIAFGMIPPSAESQILNSGQVPRTSGSSGTGLPKIVAPTRPRTVYTRYPWKLSIVATIFWIGEDPSQNNPTPNNKSSWDGEWEKNYGGYDDPDPKARTADFCPIGFVPQENPFYIALPYNDVAAWNKTKPEAARVIPWFRQRFTEPGKTVLENQWVAIRYKGRICYAQWEDCGPFNTQDYKYVFGNARPMNTKNNGAGIDVSPAVRDCLRMPSGAKVDWRFVDLSEVTHGPWCKYGRNNDFAQNQSRKAFEQQKRLDELKRMRDEWFRNKRQPQSL